MNLTFRKIVFSFVLISFLTGCSSLGPDYKRPDFKIENLKFKENFKTDVKNISYDRWWRVFNDNKLNSLVETVLINNLDIKTQNSSVDEILAYFKKSKSDQLPSFSSSFDFQQTRAANSYDIKTTTDSYTLAFPISYEIDIWGKIRRTKESAFADLMQAKHNRIAVIHSIIAQTVNLYLTIEHIERKIFIKKRKIDAYENSFKIIKRKFEKGLATILELNQTRSLVSKTKSELPQLIQDLEITQHKISLVSGKFPKRELERVHPEQYFKMLEPVPVGLPSDLLKRRPDILLAEQRLRSLNAKIGIAKANRFPSLTLTATFGYSSDSLGTLFDTVSSYSSFVSGLTAPIFNSGKLKALQKIAEEQYKKGIYSYYKSILTAFKEVDDTLVIREKQLLKRDLVLKYLKDAQLTQKIAEIRYEKGLVNYQTVLDAMHNTFVAEEILIAVDYTIYANRVNIHKSLGGGWYKTVKSKVSK